MNTNDAPVTILGRNRFSKQSLFRWHLEWGVSYVWRRHGLIGGDLRAWHVELRVGPWRIGAMREPQRRATA